MISAQNMFFAYNIYNASSRSLRNMALHSLKTSRLVHDHGVIHVKALNDCNFSITDGERVGLLGGNGAGKSTLLKLLSRVYFPTAGQLRIDGRVTSLLNYGLGIVPDATGREAIVMCGVYNGLTLPAIKLIENDIIEFAELNEFIDAPISTYSTGMVMRLNFAIITALKPDIMILDEFLSAGDASFITKAQKRINQFMEKARIVVVASHNMDLISQNCTRAMVIQNGSIIFDGKPDEAIDYYLQS